MKHKKLFCIQWTDEISRQIFGVVQVSVKGTAKSRDFQALAMQPNEDMAELAARMSFSSVV